MRYALPGVKKKKHQQRTPKMVSKTISQIVIDRLYFSSTLSGACPPPPTPRDPIDVQPCQMCDRYRVFWAAAEGRRRDRKN